MRNMGTTNSILSNHSILIKNLEVQVGDIIQALNHRSQGSLPSDTIPNPNDKIKEQVILWT